MPHPLYACQSLCTGLPRACPYNLFSSQQPVGPFGNRSQSPFLLCLEPYNGLPQWPQDRAKAQDPVTACEATVTRHHPPFFPRSALAPLVSLLLLQPAAPSSAGAGSEPGSFSSQMKAWLLPSPFMNARLTRPSPIPPPYFFGQPPPSIPCKPDPLIPFFLLLILFCFVSHIALITHHTS